MFTLPTTSSVSIPTDPDNTNVVDYSDDINNFVLHQLHN